jgi:DNA mismatch repair protein MutL
MPRIERLPEDLVNKIAAGEVVERPASVAKELIENALDAGARFVHADIEAGGKRLIRVRDDGCGMDREDAQRALERHATSKVKALDDLQEIATHGFRGEALPAIASVSHLLLRTCEQDAAAGTEVEVRYGRLQHVKDVGHPRGTTVEVRDLFGSVPARRKFLRADATESGHVAEAVTLLALAWPRTGFRLASSGRSLVQAPATEGLAARISQLFGPGRLEELLAVAGRSELPRVWGFVSRPGRRRAGRSTVRLFVNRRPIRDRVVAKAVADAYRATGAGDRPYEAFLFLEAPTHLVDVNVHPTKAEVRFADARGLYSAVEEAVRAALSPRSGTVASRFDTSRPDTTRVEQAIADFWDGAGRVAEGPERSRWNGAADSTAVSEGPPEDLFPPAPPTVLGQYRRTYIVATDGEDLLLADQHTSHERVRFEALLSSVAKRAAASQLLVSPHVLTLPPALRPLLEAAGEALAELGYEVESFGADTAVLRAVPALVQGSDPASGLLSALKDLQEREATAGAPSDLRDALAASLACHTAVRAGQTLSIDAMAAILRDLSGTAHPTLCPHGRPTVVKIPREDVARWFGRTGWRRQ